MVHTQAEGDRTTNEHVRPAMSKNSSSVPCEPRVQPRNAAQPEEELLNADIKYTEESLPMRLDEAMEYFRSRLTKEFLVTEGFYSHKGCERVAKGE